MIETAALAALDYYAAIGAALFPIPAGAKNPTGIVQSFAHDCSADPAQWAAWSAAHPGCNFGVVAGPSRLIIVDIDTKEGRDAAWSLWCEVCASWGLPEPLAPQVQSARGGWHVYCAVPPEVDSRALRQPDAVKKLINIRAGNGYVVGAGSHFEGLPYVLLSLAAPYPAPGALVEHCTRRERTGATPPVTGSRDAGDVANLMKWLAEREAFGAYEDWCGVGMSLKLEFGDAGLELWRITHDDTVTPDVEATKWQSFTTEPTPGVQTLNTWLDRAHKLGWRGSVRKSTAALFDGVAAIAAAAGASLPVGTPGPTGGTAIGLPMLEGQAELTRIAAPILDEFLAATTDAPERPMTPDYPVLPESCASHGLYAPLQTCIARIIAMAETPRTFRGSRIIDVAAVLSLVHKDVFDSVCRRIRTLGAALPDSKIKLAAAAIADRVERAFVRQDDWIYGTKGEIEHDNSDNVAVFLGILGCEIRWNAWLERMEIRGDEWRDWTYIDDPVVAKMRTRGNRTKTRFRPGKEFFWESLLALSHANSFDPVRDRLDELAAAWDGTPRLSTWLSRVCGVPCDPYHQAVGRNIVGGMVRRARQPGCKHDTMAVLYGPQGTGKSTLAAILALSGEWFTDSIMFGDASKELVLSLAGKLVVEIGEMGMRGGTNAAHVKAMVSRQVDEGRTAYARAVTRRPRRNIFIGTTNDNEPLTDPTGNRRFLPVRLDRELDLDWLRENVAQLVGEAAAREATGISFDLPREVWADAAERQEAARQESDVETLLNDWFAPTEHTANAYITASDLVELMRVANLRGMSSNSARSAQMQRLGFRTENIIFTGKKTRVWLRGTSWRPVEGTRGGVRYTVGADTNGRPIVRVVADTSGAPPIPGAQA
jgi:predicted P-loop ATPase